MTLKTCVFGASGYAGIELISILQQHSQFSLCAAYVSQHSADDGVLLRDLYPRYPYLGDLTLQAAGPEQIADAAQNMDVIFLATPHEFSHDVIPQLLAGKAKVMDLSGAFRIKNATVFEQFYGFPHLHAGLLEQAVYGLTDWHQDAIAQANLVAVPGCYPTASLLALKPVVNMLDSSVRPVINATSGVSGAGRKAALKTSLCEVSLQAYGVLGHRHLPEIESWLGAEVIFTPHLGNFKRGILATVTAKLKSGLSESDVQQAFEQAYAGNTQVRLSKDFPKVDDVAHTARCDIAWKYEASSGYIVISSAIDNLLKGAAAQALQCANLACGLDKNSGLPL